MTNLPVETTGHAVIAAYHDPWRVEASFRITKSDLRARPVFHRQRDAIGAHLTVVFAALVITHFLTREPGESIKKIVRTLRLLRTVAIGIDGPQTAPTRPSRARPARLLD
ncbi:hypothetical protein KZX45_06020 [Georgenia sp. EYE_87]|uniref:hypothetical protein n=1 Tax=Georgenia sp. EYE_87 TaxID=2853448 RepID=UPI002004D028|nr:hypothetical protein [Georgenia sp. EYE_87]MCK6210097.1 hypothetical protein [Georgenia sp. EYE_87]